MGQLLKKKYGTARLVMDVVIIAVLLAVLKDTGTIFINFLLIPLEAASMLIILTNCDEQWKWGKYAAALPVSKKQIVGSRYMFAGISALCGFCAALAVNVISYLCFRTYDFGYYLFLSAASFWVVLLFLYFILPSNYWLGVNAGFAVMFVLLILVIAAGVWAKFADHGILEAVGSHFYVFFVCGFAGVLVLAAVSYVLSVFLLKRRYV